LGLALLDVYTFNLVVIASSLAALHHSRL